MFAVSKNGHVGSAGIGLCVCIGLRVFMKHKPIHKTTLSCSKVVTHITFLRLVEQEEKFWSQIDLCCSSGSPRKPQSPHFSSEGNGVHLRAVRIRDLTRVIGSMAELELEKVPLPHPGFLNLEAVYLFPLIKSFSFCFPQKGEVILKFWLTRLPF